MARPLPEQQKRKRFERLVLPHFDAAYNLAIWLVRNEAQAEEAVQEAYLRAFQFFDAFRGEYARPWLLRIVRNTCYTLIARNRALGEPDEFDESDHGEESVAPGAVVSFPANPETAAIESADRELVQQCVRALPAEFREVVILRELQECSYKEISAIAEIPIGTVMSRLARGRRLLEVALDRHVERKETGT